MTIPFFSSKQIVEHMVSMVILTNQMLNYIISKIIEYTLILYQLYQPTQGHQFYHTTCTIKRWSKHEDR